MQVNKQRGFAFVINLMALRRFLCLLLWMTALQLNAQNTSVTLNVGWRFRKSGDHDWMNATVPGTVHTDLFQNGVIPDPFFSDNEKKLQWIDTCEIGRAHV